MVARRYHIRKADTKKEDDRITLMKLHAECFPWDNCYALDGANWWLAFCGSTPIGFCCLAEEKDQEGYLARSGVIKRHRGHGLQKRFLNLREREARKLGYRSIVSDCTTDNVVSLNNLLSHGFKPFWPEERWALVNSVYLKKELLDTGREGASRTAR